MFDLKIIFIFSVTFSSKTKTVNNNPTPLPEITVGK